MVKAITTVEIDIIDAKHCDNNCRFMRVVVEPGILYDVTCDLYDVLLSWNRRRKRNGYMRCSQCCESKEQNINYYIFSSPRCPPKKG